MSAVRTPMWSIMGRLSNRPAGECDSGLRSGHRPGHHQYAGHHLRPFRPRGRPASARARADPAAGGLGRTQSRSDLGAHGVRADHRAELDAVAGRRPAALGITNQRETALVWDRRPAGHTTTPSSGRTPGPTTSPPHWSATGGDVIRRRRVSRRPPTSRRARSSGSWTTSTACGAAAAKRRRAFGTPDTWVLWNRPVARAAACTSPM